MTDTRCGKYHGKARFHSRRLAVRKKKSTHRSGNQFVASPVGAHQARKRVRVGTEQEVSEFVSRDVAKQCCRIYVRFSANFGDAVVENVSLPSGAGFGEKRNSKNRRAQSHGIAHDAHVEALVQRHVLARRFSGRLLERLAAIEPDDMNSSLMEDLASGFFRPYDNFGRDFRVVENGNRDFRVVPSRRGWSFRPEIRVI